MHKYISNTRNLVYFYSCFPALKNTQIQQHWWEQKLTSSNLKVLIKNTVSLEGADGSAHSITSLSKEGKSKNHQKTNMIGLFSSFLIIQLQKKGWDLPILLFWLKQFNILTV